MNYVFKWKPEILFALATFATYVGGAFVMTGDNPVTDWQDWAIGTCVAAARVVVAGLVGSMTKWMATRGAEAGA